MKSNHEVILVRHLADQDSLLQQGVDGSLIAGQEKEAEKIADSIYANAEKSKASVLLFIASPQKRAIETVEIVGNFIKEKKSRIKIRHLVNNNLRTLDQGHFILPKGYKDGDFFEGLALAKKIFDKEKFNDNPDLDNFTYCFGDPVKLPDGGYKYPELVGYFSKPGESYRDFLVRIYYEIITYSETVSRYGEKVKPILFTHNLVSFIFRDLRELSHKILYEDLVPQTGQVARLCFDIYKNDHKYDTTRDKDYGRIDIISADNILVPKIAALLKTEAEFLKKL